MENHNTEWHPNSSTTTKALGCAAVTNGACCPQGLVQCSRCQHRVLAQKACKHAGTHHMLKRSCSTCHNWSARQNDCFSPCFARAGSAMDGKQATSGTCSSVGREKPCPEQVPMVFCQVMLVSLSLVVEEFVVLFTRNGSLKPWAEKNRAPGKTGPRPLSPTSALRASAQRALPWRRFCLCRMTCSCQPASRAHQQNAGLPWHKRLVSSPQKLAVQDRDTAFSV